MFLSIQITRSGGGKQHWYLNKKTWLPVKMAVEGGGGRFAPGSWIFDGWRKVDGIMIAHFVFMEEGIFSREYFIEKVEVNPSVQDSVFNKPAS